MSAKELIQCVFVVVMVSCIGQVAPADTDIYTLHVTSDISYRFATTRMRSQIANSKTEAAEISFSVQLPKAAFIANFSMEIDGVVYPGDVKEKEQARKQYEKAKQRGQSAGHVAASPRNSNKFQVAVNVAAQSKVTFDLLYQELLERRLGIYEHVININPGQVVRDLRITVNLHESREITLLRVPPIRNEIQNTVPDEDAENELAEISRTAPNMATVTWSPSREEQEAASAQGMAGQFVVQYDVARQRDGGEIQVVDGYFVHFIAPRDVTVGDKAILFILDVSGSMSGSKMTQVHSAMNAILTQLRPGDYFNMMKFSSGRDFWRQQMQPATSDKITKGKQWATGLSATGSTNINLAVTDGVRHVTENVRRLTSERDSPIAPLIIFLTDGLPSAGVQGLQDILDNVKRANEHGVTLFSLGFGNDVDFNFLKKMALQNKGFARKIYADSDADIQLQGFYQEVASPVLSDVTVEYLDDAANNETLTNNKFHTYFKGTELVVAGSLNDVTSNRLVARVSGNSAEGPLVFNMVADVGVTTSGGLVLPSPADLQDNIERTWAYLTIKEILEKRLESDDKDEKERLKERALELSLRYHFVTPVTSMVVTKPDEPPVNQEVTEEGDEDTARDQQRILSPGSPSRVASLPVAPPPRRYHSRPTNFGGSRGGGGGSRGYADNDPHFVVKVEGSPLPVCFDVMGNIGDIYQLLHDPELNLTVNGLVVGKPDPNVAPSKQKTYFGEIGIVANGTRASITPGTVRINNRDRRWKKGGTFFKKGSLSFHFVTKHFLKIYTAADDVTISLMRHLRNNPKKVDFMGIYMEEDKGLSESPHGLLGQFKDLRVNIQEDNPGSNRGNKTTGTMTFPQSFNRKPVPVHKGQRFNMAAKQHTKCWFVRNNGLGLLDGRIHNYRVPDVYYSRLAPGLQKKFTI